MSICSWRVFVYTKTSLLLRTTAIHGGSDAVDAFRFAKASDVISYTDHTHVITDYRYDSFGRRIHTAERTKSGMRTIYDGLSFEVVKEAETFLGTRGITSSATGEANLTNYNPHGSDHTRGTRYYYISEREHELRTDKNGEALPDRTKGVRTYLYLNDQRVAVNNLYNTNHGQYYYGSDILGSVRFITGQAGQELNRIEYDIFGGIYKGNSPYGLETGYTGKPYDSVTGLSDYGFRDYSPAYARFSTEDPIRDGENWFAYVGNNPVNWVDPWGLAPMQEPTLERDHCGGGGGACVAFGIVTLVNYLEDGIKETGKTIANGVAQGAQWTAEKISKGFSAITGYFSKGKKVRDKENHAIPPGNQNSQQRQGNELKPETPEIPDPSKLGEPGYIPPGGGGGGWKNNVIVAGFLALLYDASKGTVPPIPSAPTPLSPPGKQTPVMESYPPAENGLGSNKQNTTNLKGK